jgi:hypothetical protein
MRTLLIRIRIDPQQNENQDIFIYLDFHLSI